MVIRVRKCHKCKNDFDVASSTIEETTCHLCKSKEKHDIKLSETKKKAREILQNSENIDDVPVVINSRSKEEAALLSIFCKKK